MYRYNAGGYSSVGPDGKVCYYYGAPDTVYERLGHGEVVRTSLSSGDGDKAVADLREFSATYFKNFRKVGAVQVESSWTHNLERRLVSTLEPMKCDTVEENTCL